MNSISVAYSSAGTPPRLQPILRPANVRLEPEQTSSEGDHLVFRPGGMDGLGWRGKTAFLKTQLPADILERFCRLASTPAGRKLPSGRFLRFARSHGVLGLCLAHGLPCCHSAHIEIRRRRDGQKVYHPIESCPASFYEPIKTWRALAREAKAIRLLRSGARASRLWEDALWLTRQRDPQIHPPAGSGERETITTLAECVNTWLSCGGVRPQLAVDPGAQVSFPFRFELLADPEFPNLFGALAVALAEEVYAGGGRKLCVACGWNWFKPTRNQTCCPDCRAQKYKTVVRGRPIVKVTMDRANKALRARKREAKRLHREGHSYSEIARRLGLKKRHNSKTGQAEGPALRVRRWVAS